MYVHFRLQRDGGAVDSSPGEGSVGAETRAVGTALFADRGHDLPCRGHVWAIGRPGCHLHGRYSGRLVLLQWIPVIVSELGYSRILLIVNS